MVPADSGWEKCGSSSRVSGISHGKTEPSLRTASNDPIFIPLGLKNFHFQPIQIQRGFALLPMLVGC